MHTIKKPYKHGLRREFIQTVYENFFKKIMGNTQKKDLEKGRGLCSFFQGLIFVVRINYNLPLAKSCSAMTQHVLAKMIYSVCRL